MSYSRPSVAAAIAALENEGYTRNQAILIAFNSARAAYFKRYPHGALPEWLAYPKGQRLAQHYAPNGAPMREPIKNHARRDVESNPVRKPADTERARRLLEGFTESPAAFTKLVDMADFRVGFTPGRILGIIYETRIAGEPKRYIHHFHKVKSRPLLVISSDGKQFRSLGGGFRFTDRGFVDD